MIPARRSLRSAHFPEKFHASKTRIKMVYVNIRTLCSQKMQTVQLQKSRRSCLEIACKQVRMGSKSKALHQTLRKRVDYGSELTRPLRTKGISSDRTAIPISALQISPYGSNQESPKALALRQASFYLQPSVALQIRALLRRTRRESYRLKHML